MKEVTGLLVMDVDGTLIRQEGIDLLAQEAGVGEKVAEITAQAMNGGAGFCSIFRGACCFIEGIGDLYLSENFGADGSHTWC